MFCSFLLFSLVYLHIVSFSYSVLSFVVSLCKRRCIIITKISITVSHVISYLAILFTQVIRMSPGGDNKPFYHILNNNSDTKVGGVIEDVAKDLNILPVLSAMQLITPCRPLFRYLDYWVSLLSSYNDLIEIVFTIITLIKPSSPGCLLKWFSQCPDNSR